MQDNVSQNFEEINARKRLIEKDLEIFFWILSVVLLEKGRQVLKIVVSNLLPAREKVCKEFLAHQIESLFSFLCLDRDELRDHFVGDDECFHFGIQIRVV